MKEIIIKRVDKEPITIIVTEAELELADKMGLSERQYIEAKISFALDDKLVNKK